MDGLEEELELPEIKNKPAPNDELPEVELIDDEPEEGAEAVEDTPKPDVNDKKKPQRSAEDVKLQDLSRQVAELGDRVATGMSQQAKDIDVIGTIQLFEDHAGTPLDDGLTTVHRALVGAGLRDRIKVGASGKVASGF